MQCFRNGNFIFHAANIRMHKELLLNRTDFLHHFIAAPATGGYHKTMKGKNWGTNLTNLIISRWGLNDRILNRNLVLKEWYRVISFLLLKAKDLSVEVGYLYLLVIFPVFFLKNLRLDTQNLSTVTMYLSTVTVYLSMVTVYLITVTLYLSTVTLYLSAVTMYLSTITMYLSTVTMYLSSVTMYLSLDVV